MSRPGDWNCRTCQHLNFQRRDSCQRCGESKSGDFAGFGGRGGSGFGFSTGSDVRLGDWYCTIGNCGTHNFANRSTCFKCGAYKDDFNGGIGGAAAGSLFDSEISRARAFGFGGVSMGGIGIGIGSGGGGGGGGAGNRSGWKSGDWICIRPGCNEHNFASRMECFRCGAPRELSSRTSY